MIEIGAERQLFVDDRLISRVHGLERRLHRARKRGPVLIAERPWEGTRVYCFGTVLRDETEGYRMWYISRLGGGNQHRAPGLSPQGDEVCYATSPDGVHWERPNLGLSEFDGSTDNNILFANGHCPSVLYDPDAPDDERYRMAVHGWGEHAGYTLRHSADGLRWTFYDESPMFSPTVRNEVMCLTHDPRTRRYFAYHRRWADNYTPRRRVIGASWSDDFRHWSPARLIIVPDEQDIGHAFSERLGAEFYDMSGFWYESGFLGILPVFVVESYEPDASADGSNKSPWDGPIEGQFVHSNDGLDWRRFEDRTPILPRGDAGSFDAGCILGCANAPVIHDDQVWLYYTGVNTTHGGSMPPKTISIGLAVWRRDGFVSLAAGDRDGYVETPPLLTVGSQLYINANSTGGQLTAEIVTVDGAVRRGFSRAECVRCEGDAVRHRVTWRERRGIDPTHPFRLRFHLRNADLYSYRFE